MRNETILEMGRCGTSIHVILDSVDYLAVIGAARGEFTGIGFETQPLHQILGVIYGVVL